MFAARFFPSRMFAARFFPKVGFTSTAATQFYILRRTSDRYRIAWKTV